MPDFENSDIEQNLESSLDLGIDHKFDQIQPLIDLARETGYLLY